MSYRQDINFMDYERSMRSCFVGNIPYEATEEELKDIFAEVGTVASFRLVYDRDSGKPKGYGFAEFADQETALSAMRNLNSRELHGRTLRVDHATNDKIRPAGYPFGGPDDDMYPAPQPPPPENPYGEAVSSKEAPEAISKAVASLPPEQMFELMKQMKQCIQNNPVEARNMLLQNPQLAYALLQAQVVMKIVDPEIAMKMLHRQSPVPPPILNEQEPERMDVRANGDGHPFNPDRNRPGEPPVERMDPRMGPGPGDRGPMGRGNPHDMGRGPPQMVPPPGQQRRGMEPNRPGMEQGRPDMGPNMEARPGIRPGMGPNRPGMDRPGINRPGMDHGRPDMGMNRPGIDPGRPDMGPNRPGIEHGRPDMGPMRPGMDHNRPGVTRPGMEPNRPGMQDHDRMNNRPPMNRGQIHNERTNLEENQPDKTDPRGRPTANIRPPLPVAAPDPTPAVDTQDQEKAALIMQVLQLTPEQIALLPEEQRKSILILKEQIQGGGA